MLDVQRAPSFLSSVLVLQHCEDSNPKGLSLGLQHPGAMGGPGGAFTGGGEGGGGGGEIFGGSRHIASLGTLLASFEEARLPSAV